METLLNEIIAAAGNTGIWCMLFLIVSWIFYRKFEEQLKKADDREQRLNEIIKNQGLALQEITKTLERINDRLETIEGKIE